MSTHCDIAQHGIIIQVSDIGCNSLHGILYNVYPIRPDDEMVSSQWNRWTNDICIWPREHKSSITYKGTFERLLPHSIFSVILGGALQVTGNCSELFSSVA